MNALPLRLLLGAEQACGYLPMRLSRSAFVAPHAQLNGSMYGRLIAHGFRRIGDFAYRPACQSCNACVPVRVPVPIPILVPMPALALARALQDAVGTPAETSAPSVKVLPSHNARKSSPY